MAMTTDNTQVFELVTILKKVSSGVNLIGEKLKNKELDSVAEVVQVFCDIVQSVSPVKA